MRTRVGWTGSNALCFFVRRLKCPGCPGRRPGTKCATFTVLPNFVHPLKRYMLAEINGVIRRRFLYDLSLSAMAKATPPGGPALSTQQDWCQGFFGAAPLCAAGVVCMVGAAQAHSAGPLGYQGHGRGLAGRGGAGSVIVETFSASSRAAAGLSVDVGRLTATPRFASACASTYPHPRSEPRLRWVESADIDYLSILTHRKA